MINFLAMSLIILFYVFLQISSSNFEMAFKVSLIGLFISVGTMIDTLIFFIRNIEDIR